MRTKWERKIKGFRAWAIRSLAGYFAALPIVNNVQFLQFFTLLTINLLLTAYFRSIRFKFLNLIPAPHRLKPHC
jgi:hypothetical protein